MYQTLFHIKTQFYGVPLFGFGWLLGIWALASAIFLAWLYRRQGLSSDTWGWFWVLLLVAGAIAFVGPRLVQAEGLPIRGFGMMLLAAIVAGVGLSGWRARRCGWDPELVYSLCFWLCISGVVGARLFYIIQYRDDFQSQRLGAMLIQMLNIAQGGIVFYGSIFGAVAAGLVWAAIYKTPALAMADILAPGLALGIGIGRLGCFLNGCCYGGVCDLPWAVQFPQGSPPHEHQLRRGEISLHGLKLDPRPDGPATIAAIEPGSPAAAAGLRAGDRIDQINGFPIRTTLDAWQVLQQISLTKAAGVEHSIGGRGVPYAPGQVSIRISGQATPREFKLRPPPERSLPVHPTQLYSAIGGTLLCLVLLAFDPLRRRDGQVIALLATLYPIERFLVEILRDDELGIMNTGMTISQNISLGLFVFGLALWAFIATRPRGSFRASPA